MKIIFHKKFRKLLQKLPRKIQEKFFERLRMFKITPFHPTLNNHSVNAAYPGSRSINITGNYRALFEIKEKDTVVFIKIGTHPELY